MCALWAKPWFMYNVLTFESVNEILRSDNSNVSCWGVQGTFYQIILLLQVEFKKNCQVCALAYQGEGVTCYAARLDCYFVCNYFWQLRLAYSDQRDEITFLETQLRAKDAKITQLEKENQYLKSQRWVKCSPYACV